ncbi:MAG: hypothetical protein GWN73_17320, partial [Actinobacteria bacterium]|nr:hypothetical protein [Actinomycetota bacterium]NIS32016.1 hypothetical protein [Actinomycetota bacterium]NIU67088.1 hypothetical protein [Actinomycetota bacterium]
LLKKVVRPLEGSFVLGYQLQGNRVDYSDPEHRIDMPGSQWVLSSVALDDGQGNVYETTWDYFDDAFYDREERQAYGYARVQATLGDGSTVDTRYHNQDFYSRNLPRKVTR